MKTLKTLVVIGSLLLLAACKKDSNGGGGGYGAMRVKMTDAPGDYLAVNVEIKEVQIHYDNGDPDSSGWISLPTNAGVYDLLKLRDSVTATIAHGTQLRTGKVTQMRLILDDGNTVEVDAVGTMPLKVPSGEQTGIKININHNITLDSTLEITLDFDAEKSVVKQGNGDYHLKPVMKVKSVWTR